MHCPCQRIGTPSPGTEAPPPLPALETAWGLTRRLSLGFTPGTRPEAGCCVRGPKSLKLSLIEGFTSAGTCAEGCPEVGHSIFTATLRGEHRTPLLPAPPSQGQGAAVSFSPVQTLKCAQLSQGNENVPVFPPPSPFSSSLVKLTFLHKTHSETCGTGDSELSTPRRC